MIDRLKDQDFTPQEHRHMALALQLAQRGIYTTNPNPRVGCVLAKQRKVVGKGWHQWAGQGHAEIRALEDAGNEAKGATAFVTLEPCCHHGRTPPCSEALLRAGVSEVVIAMTDPNPQVAGGGIQQLRQAGISVRLGLLEDSARRLNPGFISRMARGRPYVRCKMAMSVDGRTAMAGGESKWITGSQAREDAHRLRARSSAILTGIGTVLADDPSFDIRLPDPEPPGGWRQPLRVILDPNLEMSSKARLVSLPGEKLVVGVGNGENIRLDQGPASVETVFLGASQTGFVDLQSLMTLLAQRQVNEVLLESGATLAGAVLEQGLIDELVIYMAAVILGDNARGLFHLPLFHRMAQKIPLHIENIRAVGEDWRIVARPGNVR